MVAVLRGYTHQGDIHRKKAPQLISGAFSDNYLRVLECPPDSAEFSRFCRVLQRLQCPLDLDNLVCLNNIANFDIVVALDVQTAVVAALYLFNVIFETFQ